MDASRGSAADIFLGFEGRLDRERWLGGVAVLVALLLAAQALTWGFAESGLIAAATRDGARAFVGVFLLVPWTAMDWKRFHDLDHPGALALICPGLFIGSLVWEARALAAPPGHEIASTALGLAQGIVALWLAYALAYRSGTPGANRFGPPPAPPQPKETP